MSVINKSPSDVRASHCQFTTPSTDQPPRPIGLPHCKKYASKKVTGDSVPSGGVTLGITVSSPFHYRLVTKRSSIKAEHELRKNWIRLFSAFYVIEVKEKCGFVFR